MTRDQEDYFTNMFELLNSKGWKELVKEFEVLKEYLTNLDNIRSQDELMYTKGRLEVVNQLLNLKDTTERYYEQAEEDENAA